MLDCKRGAILALISAVLSGCSQTTGGTEDPLPQNEVSPAPVFDAPVVDEANAEPRGVANAPPVPLPAPRPETIVLDPNARGPFVAEFRRELDDFDWYVSDFSYKSKYQRAAWEADNVLIKDAIMDLSILKKRGKGKPYQGAEVQRKGRYHYGRYEVVMRAARGSGLVSSFFTHVAPPHDEIDIEFTGSETSILQLNTFKNGKPDGVKRVKLPYDAADEFQLYAFEWYPDSVSWYVDDELVHVIGPDGTPIPSTPARIIVNLWSGGDVLSAWHGSPTFKSGTTASYQCISYQTPGAATEQCSDRFEFDLPRIY